MGKAEERKGRKPDCCVKHLAPFCYMEHSLHNPAINQKQHTFVDPLEAMKNN